MKLIFIILSIILINKPVYAKQITNVIKTQNNVYWFLADIAKKINTPNIIKNLEESNKILLPSGSVFANLTSKTGVFITNDGFIIGGILTPIKKAKRSANRKKNKLEIYSNNNCFITYSYEIKDDKTKNTTNKRKEYSLNIYGALIENKENKKRGAVSNNGELKAVIYNSSSTVYNKQKEIIGNAQSCNRVIINLPPPEEKIKENRNKIKNRFSKK